MEISYVGSYSKHLDIFILFLLSLHDINKKIDI